MSCPNNLELPSAHRERTGRCCKGCPFEDVPSCLLATFRADLVMADAPCGFAWTSGAAHDEHRLAAEANHAPATHHTDSREV